MTSPISASAYQLLKIVSDKSSHTFSGLGVVFYRELDLLPRLSLGNSETPLPNLPIEGIEPIADALATISDYKNPWHDGFHLIDVEFWTLTHVSQFLSPTLPADEREIGLPRPAGARNMTALLVSKIKSIECVGLLTHSKEICVFQNGHQIIKSK
jgi:hypothetical protein